MARARTLVVGGGIAGLSTAWHLAHAPGRAGARDVVLLERERQLAAHSSGKNAAILRTHAPDAPTAALLRAGARFLASPPEGFAPVPLLDRVGLVVAGRGPAPDPLPPGATRLALDALRGTLGGVAAPADWALRFADEGRIDVAALADGFARGARARGAALETGARVERLLARGGRVCGVRLASGEEIGADATVLAAGGWAERLGASAGSRVAATPTRRHLLVTAPDARVDPRWPVVWHDAEGLYARPESGGLLVCGCDETPVDPDACEVDPAVRETIAEKVARVLPAFADAGAAHFWCGLRTFAPDRRFLVGPDPDVAGLFWVAALGGHGMGAAPEVGRIAALRIRGRAPREAAERAVDPARFTAAASR